MASFSARGYVALSEGYASHPFHALDRDWPESNCYADVWIELLHSRGLEVSATLGGALANDFEGDQWTFFKPTTSELFRLYGLQVEELMIWRDFERHLLAQSALGRVPLVEVDGFFLPDTEGQSYRRSHAKTTIGVDQIDAKAETLRYFHNRGRWTLSGADYRAIMRIDPVPSDADMIPYCEIVKLDRLIKRSPESLHGVALDLLNMHVARCPVENPIPRYAATVERDLVEIAESNPDDYDEYAFAAIRQCGVGFRFAADHLEWLGAREAGWKKPAEAFATISSLSSMLVLKMARIAHSGRMRDLSATFLDMERAWEHGMTATRNLLPEPQTPNSRR